MMMGTGNLTELTDADSSGVTAVLAGHLLRAVDPQCACRQCQPAHDPHGRGARSRAPHHVCCQRNDDALPRGYDAGLLQVHDRKPYPNSDRGY